MDWSTMGCPYSATHKYDMDDTLLLFFRVYLSWHVTGKQIAPFHEGRNPVGKGGGTYSVTKSLIGAALNATTKHSVCAATTAL